VRQRACTQGRKRVNRAQVLTLATVEGPEPFSRISAQSY